MGEKIKRLEEKLKAIGKIRKTNKNKNLSDREIGIIRKLIMEKEKERKRRITLLSKGWK